jgi:flagellar biosynthesis component FlhA
MLYLIVPLAVLVGIIWALVVFPSFRVVAVILVVLGAAAYFVMSEKVAQEQKQQEAKKAQDEEQRRVAFEAERKDYCKAEQKRWTLVPATQIEIRNPSLTQGPVPKQRNSREENEAVKAGKTPKEWQKKRRNHLVPSPS